MKLRAAVLASFAMVFILSAARPVQAQDTKSPYPNMAPIEQYLIADRNAEIELARTAAPKSISDDASVVVLDRQQGFVTAVKGKNGFVCIVERAWTSPFDDPEFWNPKNRSPICYNPAAARSVLLYTLKRTEFVLAGLTKSQILDRTKAAVANKELPEPEPGAMSYMLSKEQYLNDAAVHWHPHLMFHIPKVDGATWGANLDGSPVLFDPRGSVEPEVLFFVPVGKWSDGTPATLM
ncbi:MAG TPA: hypothetical protein VKR59_19355 [Terriglobales bacterium]|nr:hypothetical protein [Terriglobales bacterium]